MFFLNNGLRRCWPFFNFLLLINLSFIFHFILLIGLVLISWWLVDERLLLVPGRSEVLLFIAASWWFFGKIWLFLLPCPQRWFINTLCLILPYVPLKCHSVLLHIDLKLKLVIFWKVGLILMPTLIILLEVSNKLINVNFILPKLKILIIFPLDHGKWKIMFFKFDIIG